MGCCSELTLKSEPLLTTGAHLFINTTLILFLFLLCEQTKLAVLRTISKLLQENQLIRQRLVELNKTK